jgi:hypothetical protein
MKLVEQGPAVSPKSPGIENGRNVEQNIINHTALWFAWPLPMNNLQRAPNTLVRVRHGVPDPEWNGCKVRRPGHQLERVSGFPSIMLLRKVQQAGAAKHLCCKRL